MRTSKVEKETAKFDFLTAEKTAWCIQDFQDDINYLKKLDIDRYDYYVENIAEKVFVEKYGFKPEIDKEQTYEKNHKGQKIKYQMKTAPEKVLKDIMFHPESTYRDSEKIEYKLMMEQKETVKTLDTTKEGRVISERVWKQDMNEWALAVESREIYRTEQEIKERIKQLQVKTTSLCEKLLEAVTHTVGELTQNDCAVSNLALATNFANIVNQNGSATHLKKIANVSAINDAVRLATPAVTITAETKKDTYFIDISDGSNLAHAGDVSIVVGRAKTNYTALDIFIGQLQTIDKNKQKEITKNHDLSR